MSKPKPYRDMDEQIVRAVLKLLKKHVRLVENGEYIAIHKGWEMKETRKLIKESDMVLKWKDDNLGDYHLDRWLHRVAILLPHLWD